MRKPDFLIVGAPKCGTTAMTHYLKGHPKIFMPYRKEIHHFGSDLRYKSRELTDRQYCDLFADAGDDKIAGEASVWYLSSQTAAEEIHQFNPDIKIIAMLRNPIEMLYSQYYQMVFTGENYPDFDTAIATEDERYDNLMAEIAENPLREGERIRVFHSRSGNYYSQLKKYFEVFGHENVHVMIFDDFKASAATEYFRILEFLGLPSDNRTDFQIINSNKKSRSRLLQKVLLRPPQWLRKAVRAILPDGPRRKLVSAAKAANTSYFKREPMSDQTRALLVAKYQDEMAKLGELLGRDFSHWLASKPANSADTQPRQAQCS